MLRSIVTYILTQGLKGMEEDLGKPG